MHLEAAEEQHPKSTTCNATSVSQDTASTSFELDDDDDEVCVSRYISNVIAGWDVKNHNVMLEEKCSADCSSSDADESSVETLISDLTPPTIIDDEISKAHTGHNESQENYNNIYHSSEEIDVENSSKASARASCGERVRVSADVMWRTSVVIQPHSSRNSSNRTPARDEEEAVIRGSFQERDGSDLSSNRSSATARFQEEQKQIPAVFVCYISSFFLIVLIVVYMSLN